MPAEQSPKANCEICGGAHPTSEHAPAITNVQEEVSAREHEPNQEAMDKVVDIFATEDLKYRNDPILPTLETGVPTPITGFLYEPFGRLDETARKKMQEETEILEKARGAGKAGYDAFDHRRQKANVFYPEGLLKALRDKILGTKTVELWSEEDFQDVGKYLGGTLAFCISQFSRAYESLPAQDKDKLAQIIGKSSEKISLRIQDGMSYWGPINFEDRFEKEMLEILEAVFSNSEAFEIIRKAWLRIFFGDAQKESDHALTRFQYVPASGVVLSPDTRVAVSPHGDYPAQATILHPRVKPKEIIGLFVNDSSYKDVKQRFENSVFRTPQRPIEYLFANFPRPFILFLENQGFQRAELESIFNNFTSLYKKPWAGRLEEGEETKSIAEKLRAAVGTETYVRLEALAHKFIDDHSPVKDGEPLWTGLLRLAERHQLPIYNLRGELLWPKHMTHEEVTKFVDEKSEKQQ